MLGFQDPWITGSRLYFRRDPISAVRQPIVDLGIIEVASPTLEPEKITLQDADGGIKVIADEQVIAITEKYSIVCSNLNLDNLALMFLANPAGAFTQAATKISKKHYAHVGRLLKLLDADYDAATVNFIFGLSAVLGVTTGAAVAITSVTTGTKTIVVPGNVAANYSDGDTILLWGTSDAAQQGLTLTVASATFDTDHTNIVVDEAIAGSNSTGGSINKDVLVEDTDWEVASLERGMIRMIDGGAFDADGAIYVVMTPRAITGNRILYPQNSVGAIKGDVALIWSREGNTRQTVRECRVSVTPASGAFSVDNYSTMTLDFTVLADRTAANPAGRLVQWVGDLPTVS
jgi:hypothetical protein